MKKIIILALILVLLFDALKTEVFAQRTQGLDLTISPPVIELNAKPGDTIREKFQVRNNLSQSIELVVSAQKLGSSTFNGEPEPQIPGPSDEYISWVKFDDTNFTARSKEWKEVGFTIEIPKTAAYGYYYVFKISPKAGTTIEESGAALSGEVMVITLLNVKKEGAISSAKVLEFKTKNAINEYLPVDFIARIENKGNVHIRPRGNVFIRNNSNQKDVAILEINQNLATVLPGGTRSYNTFWNDGFLIKEPVLEDGKQKLDEKGNPVTRIQINWNKLTDFRMGPYTASLLMVFDDGKRDVTLEATTNFWVIPYTALTVITISLIALFFIIKFALRWYVRREIRRQRSK